MKKTLTNLILGLSLIYSQESKALITGLVEDEPLYAHGTCDYRGLKLEVTCEGTLLLNKCKVYALDKKRNKSAFPKQIRVGYTNYGEILYCRDLEPKKDEKFRCC